MKLLILSTYFPPDLSAGSFRMQALIDALSSLREESFSVDLITSSPNRYKSHDVEAPAFEDHGWLRIRRIRMPVHEGGVKDQARAYVNYVRGVRRLTAGGDWDIVFATSSRLMTAALGAHVSRRSGIPLYLDIRDLFVENMAELMSGGVLKWTLPLFSWIERRTFRRADHINVVSPGFLEHVRSVVPDVSTSVFTNGVDKIFIETDFRSSEHSDGLPLVVYAGNIGDGQGLHRVLPEAAKRLENEVRFRIIGAGGRRQLLEERLSILGVSHVVKLVDPVPRLSLLEHYRDADILFLHLNDLQAFRKVLPSKIFEYGATGCPILAGVAGYAARFMKQHLTDAELFEPCDVDAMVRSVRRLLDNNEMPDRSDFISRFDRRTVMQNMAEELLERFGKESGNTGS